MHEREGGRRLYAGAVWSALCILITVPVILAAFSPYLAYRNPAYLVGGFAGILCLSLFVVQPLLAAGYLPGAGGLRGRALHRALGVAVVGLTAAHVAGLYLASPPDAIDALLLRSPTPFSVWGVTAMWGVVATAVLVALRRRIGWRYGVWRGVHNAIALVVVVATVLHAVQIEGAMGTVTKWALCLAALAATVVALGDLRVIRPLMGRRGVRAEATARATR